MPRRMLAVKCMSSLKRVQRKDRGVLTRWPGRACTPAAIYRKGPILCPAYSLYCQNDRGETSTPAKHTPPSFPGTESTPKRASARVLVSGRMVGEDELPPTSGQQVARQTAQLAGTLLVTPQKNRPGLRPQSPQRFGRLKDARSIGELLSIPQVAARCVQHVDLVCSVEIQRGCLMVFPIDHDDVARTEVRPHRFSQLPGREHRRERAEQGMHTRQQQHHHRGQGGVARDRPAAPSKPPVQPRPEQQAQRGSEQRKPEGPSACGVRSSTCPREKS